jgi:hypothetical protein
LIRLLCVHQNSFEKSPVQDFLLSAFLKLVEPFLDFFISFVYNDLQITIGSNHTVDGSHQPRKDTDTQELYHHLKVIFHDGVALKVPVSDGGERGNDPINGGDI